MMSEKYISVAMATYNGAKYIREQLDSILKNLGENDEIVISDDGSMDGTIDIVQEYRQKDARIRLVQGEGQGIIANFENAIENCRGCYIFLSDQDDVWMPNKVSYVMQAFEERNAALVIHDARVMDAELRKEIMPSFFAYRGSGSGFWKNYMKNTYMGCCMAFRREVWAAVRPIPRDIQMHDQWIGMNSDRWFGKSVFLPECLLLYRRHDSAASDFEHNTIPIMIRNRILLAWRALTRHRK